MGGVVVNQDSSLGSFWLALMMVRRYILKSWIYYWPNRNHICHEGVIRSNVAVISQSQVPTNGSNSCAAFPLFTGVGQVKEW